MLITIMFVIFPFVALHSMSTMAKSSQDAKDADLEDEKKPVDSFKHDAAGPSDPARSSDPDVAPVAPGTKDIKLIILSETNGNTDIPAPGSSLAVPASSGC